MTPIKRLWLVDDDAIFVSLTKKMMGKMNFAGNIEVFENGQLALEHLRQVSDDGGDLPQLIFLDLMMPVLDGWGFLDEYIKMAESIRRKITLYVLSSSASPQDIKRIKRNRAVRGFITKPMPRAKFTEIVTDNVI